MCKPPADHLNGASVDLQKAHLFGRILKRGPVYGYAFQARGSTMPYVLFYCYSLYCVYHIYIFLSLLIDIYAILLPKSLGWCILTNSQIIVYKDEAFSQRQSAERLSKEAKAYPFSSHEAPGEARRALKVEHFQAVLPLFLPLFMTFWH